MNQTSKKQSHRNEISWIGNIPDNWQVEKMRVFFNERKTKVSDVDYQPLSVTKNGILPQLENVAKSNDSENRKLVKSGDFVINSRSDRKGSSGLSPLDGSVSLINIVLTPRNINPKYCHHLFKSHLFIEEYYRNGRGIVADLWTTRYSEMRNICIPVPPRLEQDLIVKFLDYKISKINKFIKEKKHEIELLKELKQAEINRAVTKGLNPNAPVKNSGIDWLGEIPEHWQVKYLRNLLKITSIKNRPEMPLLSVVREKGVILRDVLSKEENHNFIPDDLSGYKLVSKGQFVINKMKAWQGSYAVSDYDGIVSPAYYVFNLNFPIKEFFHIAIRSKIYVNFFAQFSDGIRVGQWDLSSEKMKMIPFFVPPKEEQENIIKYINRKLEILENYIAKIDQEINTLKEYKTSLISDVVTGKVDVRDVKIDETFEVETLDEIEAETEEVIEE